jgi:hypothetical protein
MEVKVISPEILKILEADVICVTEGRIHTTITEIMGTRETQNALSSGLFLMPGMDAKRLTLGGVLCV